MEAVERQRDPAEVPQGMVYQPRAKKTSEHAFNSLQVRAIVILLILYYYIIVNISCPCCIASAG